MNKADLIEELMKNKETGYESKAQAERVLNAVIGGIQQGIKTDGEVQLIGFGSFKVKSRAARIGRNPQTGAKLKIKASKTVGFKVGAALKELASKVKV